MSALAIGGESKRAWLCKGRVWADKKVVICSMLHLPRAEGGGRV
jgi:hypothetical protein